MFEKIKRLFIKDDGIDFQWGDRYIKAEELTNEGGKYWRDNKDGTITDFFPSELKFKTAKLNLRNMNRLKNFKVLKNHTLEFESESVAKEAVDEFDSDFWELNGVTAERNGKIVKLHIAETAEDTFHTT